MGKYIVDVIFRKVEVDAETREGAYENAIARTCSDESVIPEIEMYCGNCKENLDICCCDNCCCSVEDALNVEGEKNG